MNYTENDVQLFCIKGHDYFDITRWTLAEYPDIGTVYYDAVIGRDGGIGAKKENVRRISDSSRNLFVFSDLALDVIKEQIPLSNYLILFVRDCFNTFASRLLINRKNISCPVNDYTINLWKQYALEYINKDILNNCFYVNSNTALPTEDLYANLLNDLEYTSIFDEEMITLSKAICKDQPEIKLGAIYQPRVTEKAIATINSLIEKQNYDEASKILDVLKTIEDNLETKRMTAKLLSKKGDCDTAIKIMKKEINQDNTSQIYAEIGSFYAEDKKYNKAIEFTEKALKEKNCVEHQLRTNLGHYYMHNYQLNDAIDNFKIALDIVDTPGYRTNLGNAYLANHQYDEALKIYNQALNNSLSEHADIHINMGFLKYYLGDELEGWKDCEYRLKTHLADYLRIYRKEKYWDGKQNLNNKKIIIFGEQGLGDNIQFLRYVKYLKEKYNCYTIIICSTKLHELMSTSPYIDELFSKEDFIYNKEYDYHISSMSLPFVLDNFVPDCNYLNINEKIDLGDKFNIGICWKGSSGYASDMHRSCNSELFKILIDANVKLFSLQKDEEIEFAEKMYLNNFKDTAIAINSLDLIVTVDTSIMHLSATLGKPTFGMLSVYHDWRWQKTENTKWYPSLKFFKQEKGGDWASVLKKIKEQMRFLNK